MMISRRGALRLAALGTAAVLSAAGAARAAAKVRIGVLKFGTVSWELDTLKHHKFDAANGIDLEIVYFAGEDATNVAMLAGEIDIIVSDWLWVSRQRSEGDDLTLAPYSTAVGAIMVRQESPIRTIADLKQKKIGVAGGPLDKSWLLIQALARRDHGVDLADDNEIVYGAPPLLSEKAMQGELDAVLNFWHFCARLEANGFRRLVGANDAAKALGASGAVSALGYVFHEKWANDNPDAAKGFVRASAAGQGPAGPVGRRMAAPGADRPRRGRGTGKAARPLPRGHSRRGRSPRKRPTPASSTGCLPKSAARSWSAARREMAPGTFWPELSK